MTSEEIRRQQKSWKDAGGIGVTIGQASLLIEYEIAAQLAEANERAERVLNAMIAVLEKLKHLGE